MWTTNIRSLGVQDMRERVTLWRLIIGCTHKMHFLINMGGDVTQSCDKIFVPSECGYYSDRSASFQALNAQSVSVCHSHVSRRTVRKLGRWEQLQKFLEYIHKYIYFQPFTSPFWECDGCGEEIKSSSSEWKKMMNMYGPGETFTSTLKSLVISYPSKFVNSPHYGHLNMLSLIAFWFSVVIGGFWCKCKPGCF